jgi:hypothetical protein
MQKSILSFTIMMTNELIQVFHNLPHINHLIDVKISTFHYTLSPQRIHKLDIILSWLSKHLNNSIISLENLFLIDEYQRESILYHKSIILPKVQRILSRLQFYKETLY